MENGFVRIVHSLPLSVGMRVRDFCRGDTSYNENIGFYNAVYRPTK